MDEISYIKYYYFRNLFSNQELSFTILHTLWCNLNCPYCFEYKKPVYMSNDTQQALLDWIKTNFYNKRQIHIGWFGGEPLLAKETIVGLTKEIKNFCKERKATFSVSITINGFYLDTEFQELLPELSIRSVQITLDGDQRSHDSLRKQTSGEGSYNVIYKNILDFNLTLRFNCTDANFKSVRSVLESFPTYVKNKVTIFFRWVWENEASDYKEFAINMRGNKLYKELSNLYAHSDSLGWKTSNPSNSFKNGYCEVDFLDQYHIDPLGNLYLCTHTFKESEAIGSIFRNFNSSNIKYITKWYSINPFDDNECIECKLLSICLGGCRKSKFEGKKECIEEKSAIDLFTL
jgi:uncharacterized protein